MISVILPVRDEPDLGHFLFRLHEVLGSIPEDYEILIITSDKEKLYTPISPLPHQKVFKSYADSLERAILLGFSVAQGDKIIVMDADGSHPPETIPEILKGLKKHDLVVASRFLPESKFDYPLHRRLISKFFIKYAQFFGSKLTDPMSGFFGVKKQLVEKIRFRPFTWKTALEIELKSETNPLEVPFHFMKRTSGVSKAKFMTGLKLLWDIFWEVI